MRPENDRAAEVKRMVDLLDGTFLAYTEQFSATRDSSTCVVRMRESELEDVVVPEIDEVTGLATILLSSYWVRRRSRETASQIPVVGHSLSEILEQALRSGGDSKLPVLASLSDRADG